MDTVDRNLARAERDASASASQNHLDVEKGNPDVGYDQSDDDGASSDGGSSLSSMSVRRESINANRMSRISTKRDSRMTSKRYSRISAGRDSVLSTGADLELELSRIETQRTQHSATVGRRTLTNKESRKPLPAFGGGKEYPPLLPEREEYVVEFDGPNDPLHPHNWTMRHRVFLGIILGYTTLVSAFSSSIFSAGIRFVSKEFHVGDEVATLGVSLYVMGFATGPIVWAPFSELKGRKLPLLISMVGFSIFSIGCATGKDLQTVLICRFWAGVFASCPLACVAAAFSDMFNNKQRGLAITGYALLVFSGPMMAPFIGGFIVINPHMGWRWCEYISAIMGFLAVGLNIAFLKETYPPIILVDKAAELRRRTLNWGIHAKQEEIEVDLGELMTKNFSRPLRLLTTEPIVLLISIYMSFIYGLLYLFLTAYPIVFQEIHGMNPGVGGLPYFGMVLGMALGALFIVCYQVTWRKKLAANNNIVVPEWRLPPVMLGGAMFAAGLFWFGWSGYRKDIHWIVPTLSGLMTGFGLLTIFLQSLNYIVDAYLMFAASAIAANTFLRSIFGSVFPLFATYMFNALHVNWTGTLLGCVAAVLAPIPFIFWKFGARIRKRSNFAPSR